MDFLVLAVPLLLLSFGSDSLAATVSSPPTSPVSMTTPTTASTTAPTSVSVAAAQTPDWEKIRELRTKEVGSYSLTLNEEGATKLNADMNAFLIQAERLKIFPDIPGFRVWWEKNREQVMQSKTPAALKSSSVSEFTMTMYFDYAKSVAAKMDADAAKSSNPADKKKGSEYLKALIDTMWEHPLTSTVVAGGSVIGGKMLYMFVLGPGARFTNTITDFFVGPMINRIETEINRRVAPHVVWWKSWWSGDSGRSKKALKQAAKGEDLTGSAERFFHPAMKVEDMTAMNTAFYEQFRNVNAQLHGWENADTMSARATGFDQLFHQFTTLSDRISRHTSAMSSSERDLDRYAEKMMAKGAKEADIETFKALIREYQNLSNFENPQHAQLAELGSKIKAISDGWTEGLKIPKELINQVYSSQVNSVIERHRKAFALTGYLYSEMFYREYNLGVKKLPELQAWHEFARNNAGLYHELEQEKENIEKIFEKLKVKYDVQARIDERGFALGGTARPKNVVPLAHPLRDGPSVYEVPAVGETAVDMPSVHVATPECAETFGKVYEFRRRAARSIH